MQRWPAALLGPLQKGRDERERKHRGFSGPVEGNYKT